VKNSIKGVLKTILIVGDQEKDNKVIKSMLQKWAHSIEFLKKATDSLSAVERLKPGLILIDVDHLAGGGLELCDRLRRDKETEGIPLTPMP